MTMDDSFAPGGPLPDKETTDQLLDALAGGDPAALNRLASAHPEVGVEAAAAAAASAQRALAIQSSASTRAAHVRALMHEAQRLNAPGAVPAPVPEPAGRVRGRAKDRRRRWSWPRRVAVTLSAVIGISAAGLGATAALAANAQPGQALYGTKLALENAEVAVQFNPSKKVSLQARFAGERLDELTTLLAQGRAGQGGAAARNLVSRERKVTMALIQLAGQGKAPATLVRTLELDLARHAAKLARQRAASACGRRPEAASCTQLTQAQRVTDAAILRLSKLPGGVAPRGLRLGATGPRTRPKLVQ